MKKSKLFNFAIVFVLIYSLTPIIFAQEADIVPLLKKIENGQKEEAQAKLPDLIKEYPNSSNVLFLKAVLMENGQQAVAIYNELLKKYPNSKYADASLYRIYSYYYALGMYSAAKSFLNKLKKDYPGSPYIDIAQKNVPSKDKILVKDKTLLSDSVKVTKHITDNENSNEIFYTIQAGAFTVLANSQALKKNFDDAGYYSIIEDKNVGGTVFHVVYVGKYLNEDDAKKFLQVINLKYNLNGRIVKTNLPAGR